MPFTSPSSPDNEAIRELRDSVADLNKSTKWNNRIMILLTIILVVLTVFLTIPVVLEWLR